MESAPINITPREKQREKAVWAVRRDEAAPLDGVCRSKARNKLSRGVMAEPPGLPQQREAEPFAKRADQYHPARKTARNAVWAVRRDEAAPLTPICRSQ